MSVDTLILSNKRLSLFESRRKGGDINRNCTFTQGFPTLMLPQKMNPPQQIIAGVATTPEITSSIDIRSKSPRKLKQHRTASCDNDFCLAVCNDGSIVILQVARP